MTNKKKKTTTKKKTTRARGLAGRAVIVRAYSGVFYGRVVSQSADRIELAGARQVWSWDSAGLAEPSRTCPDIASRGLGSGSKLSSPADLAIIEQVGAVFVCSDVSVAIIEAQSWGAIK